jgi:hypothetical protein
MSGAPATNGDHPHHTLLHVNLAHRAPATPRDRAAASARG